MKKLFISFVFLVGSAAFYSQAQVSVNINIGQQPVWGPSGYDYVEYYYLPEIDMYYNVPAGEYVYFQDNRWVSTPYLPERYRNYDLYHSYKVVLNEPRPYLRNEEYRERYASYRERRDQDNLRDHNQMYSRGNESRDNDRLRVNRDQREGQVNRGEQMNRGQQMNRVEQVNRGEQMSRGKEMNRVEQVNKVEQMSRGQQMNRAEQVNRGGQMNSGQQANREVPNRNTGRARDNDNHVAVQNRGGDHQRGRR